MGIGGSGHLSIELGTLETAYFMVHLELVPLERRGIW